MCAYSSFLVCLVSQWSCCCYKCSILLKSKQTTAYFKLNGINTLNIKWWPHSSLAFISSRVVDFRIFQRILACQRVAMYGVCVYTCFRLQLTKKVYYSYMKLVEMFSFQPIILHQTSVHSKTIPQTNKIWWKMAQKHKATRILNGK